MTNSTKLHLHDQPVLDKFYDRKGRVITTYGAGEINLTPDRSVGIEIHTNPKIYAVTLTDRDGMMDMKGFILPSVRDQLVQDLVERFDIGDLELVNLRWAMPSYQYSDAIMLEVRHD